MMAAADSGAAVSGAAISDAADRGAADRGAADRGAVVRLYSMSPDWNGKDKRWCYCWFISAGAE